MKDTILEEIFQKTTFDEKKLLSFGFKKEGNCFIYERFIVQQALMIMLCLNEKKQMSGKIIDTTFHEEYTLFRQEGIVGKYALKVKELYKELLIEIKEKCGHSDYFVEPLANEICSYIVETYHENIAFLWKDNTTNGVFLHKGNAKWYGVLMQLSLKKINQEDRISCILNVKVKSEDRNEILSIPGFYPAFHMNKKHWVSILLDGSVKKEVIISYIHNSYQMTLNERK